MIKRTNRILLFILALAFCMRLVHIIAIQSSPLGRHLFIDSEIYDSWATDIIKNGIVGNRPFYQDPLYSYTLAFIYSIFSHNLFIVRFFQILGGVLVCYFLYRITILLFNNEKAGIISSLIGALYLPFIFYEGEVEKTALGVILATLFIWSFLCAYKNKGSWIVPGILLGLAILVRSNFFILGLGLLVFFVVQKNFRKFLFFVLGLSIVIGPVVLRNSILARELTFTTTQAGQNFYIGNSPYNNTGDYSPPPWIRRHPRFEEEDFKSHAENKIGHALRPSQVSSFYFQQSFAFIVGNFGKFLNVMFKKILLYFNNYEVPDNQDIGFVAIYSPVLKIPLLQFGLVFALALAGLIFIKKRIVDLLFWTGFLIFAVSTVAFFVFSRYRIPSLPLIIPYAGFGVWRFIEIIKKKEWRSLNLPALAFAGVFILTLIPLKSETDLRLTKAQCFGNLATKYYQADSVEKAIFLFNRALAIAPFHSNSLHDLGVIYFFKKDYAQAEDYLTKCLKVEPTHYAANFFLARVCDEQNRLPEALDYYEKAKAIQPGNLEIQFNIATVLQKMGRYEKAFAVYEEMLKLAPDNPLIYHNLSVAHFHMKNYQKAKIYLDKVKTFGMAPNPMYEKALNEVLK